MPYIQKLLLFILGFVPSLIWLWYFRLRDYNPEPRKVVGIFFVRGMLSAFVALFFQWIFRDILSWDESIMLVGLPLLSVFIGALIEELSKFFFFQWRLQKEKAFDEPVDAIIYMVTVAVGFAAVENIAVLVQSDNDQIFSLFLLRFITATLLHSVAGAIIGYFFVLGLVQSADCKVRRRQGKNQQTVISTGSRYSSGEVEKSLASNTYSKEKRINEKLFIFVGLAEAIVLHTLYNLIIYYAVGTQDLGYTLWLLTFLLLFAVLIASHLTVRLNKLSFSSKISEKC